MDSARHLNLQFEGRPLPTITLSVGIAGFPEHGSTRAEILKAADAALYRAKDEARGYVVVAN